MRIRKLNLFTALALVTALALAGGCAASTGQGEVDPAKPGPVVIGDAGVVSADAGVVSADAGPGGQDSHVADTAVEVPKGLYVNEIAAQGTPIDTFNPSGGDWVELYNAGDSPLDLTGYRIASTLKPFAEAHPLPPGTSIVAHGFLIIYFNHDNAGAPVIDDKLKGSADSSLQIWSPDSKSLDSVTWKATQVIKGGSLGRTPDGYNSWKLYAKADASPGKANK